ncbi:MAG TPA: ABC transporter substrate-binding protein [Polyangiaceae bacterium]|jgi:phospholipid transport system substrate-binding protein|nr:ABC transporter substrate-binding protein [Polyangiaceae bacterium]
MTNLRKITSLFAALAFAMSLSLSAFASEAENFVKDKHTELSALLSKAKSAEDKKALDRAMDGAFDYEYLAHETLKDSWDQRTPAERSEFTNLLKDLVRNAYRKNLKKTLGYSVDYKGESDGEAGKIVKTIAHNTKNAREEPVNVDYVVHQVDGKWLIDDVVTEGSSLVHNYRSQFRRVIQKHGFDELLKRMKNKRDKGGDVD